MSLLRGLERNLTCVPCMLPQVFSGTCVHVFSGHTAWVVDAVLTNDGSLLVTASHDGTAR